MRFHIDFKDTYKIRELTRITGVTEFVVATIASVVESSIAN